MPHYMASDQGLHCLLMTLLRVSKLEWVKASIMPTTKLQLQHQLVPYSSDSQSLARGSLYSARSTLDIVVQVR